MKILVFISLFISVNLYSQEWKYQLLPEIYDDFANKDFDQLATFFNSPVELTTISASGVCSSNQAQVVLTNLFSNIQIDTLTLDIERTIGDMTLTIATIYTHEKNYKLQILTKERQVIQKIKIEEDYEQ